MNKIFMNMMIIGLFTLLANPSVVSAAQSYDIKEMTPEVLRALEGRRDRYDQLSELKAKGIIGENNKGYVELLKEGAESASLVKGENTDRKVIYQTIADQNNLTGALATIETVFASVQRDKAEAGDMIQTEDGKWVKKE